MLARMNPSKVIGLVALAEKPGLGEALRIMRRELSRHGLGSCVIETPDALEQAIVRCSMLVTFGVDGIAVPPRKLALNEVSLIRAQSGKMVDLDAEIDGELLNRYHADGVLVSTPTGSTAYSLSAGGPLVWPMSRVVCVTPICPHSLTNRSVVLPDTMTIRLRPRERRGRFDSMVYSLDGRSAYPIEVGESLVIRKAPETLSLVHLRKQNFGALLRAKLRWQGAEIPTDDE